MAHLSVQIAFWTVSAVLGGYSVFLALLMVPGLQRFALYANVFHTARWRDLDQGEVWGFAEKQIHPFRIVTSDNASLYAWHVLPLGLYYDQRKRLLAEDSAGEQRSSVALQLLRVPQSRMVIYFHGNAGCVADGWRPDAYKALSACDCTNTHIITFDYRGFGLSSSKPTEDGLIIDGVAVVDWVMTECKVPAERIVLLGHSLGTAVVAAVVDHYASTRPSLTFAGIILASGFSDIPTLMKTYLVGGVVPVLSPLTRLPRLQSFISSKIVDTWETERRLSRFAASSSKMNLDIIHAKNDYDIGWKHADVLFDAAVSGMAKEQTGKELGKYEEGPNRREYSTTHKAVRRTLLEFGGHNQILAHAPVSLAIHAAFRNSTHGQR